MTTCALPSAPFVVDVAVGFTARVPADAALVTNDAVPSDATVVSTDADLPTIAAFEICDSAL